jgi:hypothetical protein
MRVAVKEWMGVDLEKHAIEKPKEKTSRRLTTAAATMNEN